MQAEVKDLDTGADSAEVTSQTELERMAAAEAADMLRRVAAAQRRDTNRFVADVLTDGGDWRRGYAARVTPAQLWNRCRAAVAVAVKATGARADLAERETLVADLACHALANGKRRGGLTADCECGREARYLRGVVDDHGDVVTYNRPVCHLHRGNGTRIRLTLGDAAGMPLDHDVSAPWLTRTAAGWLKDGAQRVTYTPATADLPETGVSIWGDGVTAADLAAHLPGADADRVLTFLRWAVDGEAHADLAVAAGKSEGTVQRACSRGRADLATLPVDAIRGAYLAATGEAEAEAVSADPADRPDVLTAVMVARPERPADVARWAPHWGTTSNLRAHWADVARGYRAHLAGRRIARAILADLPAFTPGAILPPAPRQPLPNVAHGADLVSVLVNGRPTLVSKRRPMAEPLPKSAAPAGTPPRKLTASIAQLGRTWQPGDVAHGSRTGSRPAYPSGYRLTRLDADGQPVS